MKALLGAALGIAVLLAGAGAMAQTAGVYSGNQKNGAGVSFTLALDSNNQLAITSVGLGFKATCKGGVAEYDSGWGFGADVPVVSGGPTEFTFTNQYFYYKGSVTFTNTGATGTLANAVVPNLNNASAPPTKAVVCSQKSQSFTATLQPPSAAVTAAGRHYVFDTQGRIVGVEGR